MNRFFAFFLLLVVVCSCNNDDDDGVTTVPPEEVDDQVVVDAALIKEYLETHFYNYEEFESPGTDFDYRIKIDTISGDNSGKTALISQMQTKSISVSPSRFADSDEEVDVEHTLYYLAVRPGSSDGLQPSIADSVYVRYNGTLLDGTNFDASTEVPIWFNLATIQGTGARGFTEGAAMFKSGGEIIENEDGTFSVEDYGIGLVIFPSGLGYYNTAQTRIPAYSPLIFELDLYAVNVADHDLDGIPSIDEDINENGYMFDEEDDTDENGYPNYLDADDDGDGTSTLDEISDDDGNIIYPYPDTDGDKIPDYLDPDNS